MTRKEQIKEVAQKEMSKYPNFCITAPAFRMGAEWADAHPHWISVEEKLPPMRDKDGLSDKVLTHSKGGGIYLNRYDYGHNTWDNPYVFNVTHWMPFPQAPSCSEFPNNCEKGGEE